MASPQREKSYSGFLCAAFVTIVLLSCPQKQKYKKTLVKENEHEHLIQDPGLSRRGRGSE